MRKQIVSLLLATALLIPNQVVFANEDETWIKQHSDPLEMFQVYDLSIKPVKNKTGKYKLTWGSDNINGVTYIINVKKIKGKTKTYKTKELKKTINLKRGKTYKITIIPHYEWNDGEPSKVLKYKAE